MANLRDLKAIIKNRIVSYFENGVESEGFQNVDPEFIAEELLNKYPRDFSSYRRKNFKKFLTLVKFSIKEVDFDEIYNRNESINGNKKLKDANSSNSDGDSLSDDDYSMPESSHNLNDWITSNYQKPSTPKVAECFIIDKTGDTNLKRKDITIENKPKKKIKSEGETFLKTAETKKLKPNKAQKLPATTKEDSKSTFEVITPQCDFAELDGLEDIVSKIKSYLQIYSLGQNKLMRRGFLFSGAAGTGKTTLAKCMSHELKLPLLVASSSQLLDGLPSERGEKIDKLFEQAKSMEPCFVLIEKIDLLTNDSKEHNTTSLLSERFIKNLDDLNTNDSDVWLIATTSKVENVDPQLLKGRRFQKSFHLPLPNLSKRMNLLTKYLDSYLTQAGYNTHVIFNNTQLKDKSMNESEIPKAPKNEETVHRTLDGEGLNRTQRAAKVLMSADCTMQELAEKTPSFSAPDLKILVEEAIIHCLNKHQPLDGAMLGSPTGKGAVELEAETNASEERGELIVEVTMDDFEKALSLVKPSTMSEDIVSVPEVTWEGVGALGSIRDELSWLILKHIKHPEVFERDRLPLQGGVMLYGPPGCGKTLIAKAIANEACLNFISVAGPELKDKFVGESEKNIRMLFRRAQECAPCLIFFDEIDSICSTRGFGSESSGGINVVQQMLTELDGVKERKGVYVMGATNRIDQVDPAFLRENRFGTRFYVGLPSAEGRHEILISLTKNATSPLFSSDVDLREVAFDPRCNNLNGADLLHLVREATLVKLRRQADLQSHQAITRQHVEEVLSTIKPTVSTDHLKLYQNMALKH